MSSLRVSSPTVRPTGAEPTPDDSTASRLKVSIIVPTYRSGAGLDRVIASLDSQSMPQSDFESVFVDDGSPDDTLARLVGLAQERPNMRVTSIPPSGWPSRPRNLGLQMARGTYVVFMDHDDELYPTGLEDAWSFAARHALDALTAKETKTSSRFFTWGAFLSDVAPPEPRRPLLLSPMTPHKMYRREYLLEHDIEFPEGGPDVGKVQWEDIHFNIDVYSHSERLGVLASRPFYHWVTGTGSNSSASYTRDPDEYWRHLAGVFAHISKASLSEEDADWIRAGNYVNRVLSKMVGPGGLKRDAEYYARTLELAAAFTQRWVPLRVDAQLEGTSRVRSALLRGDRRELLRPLAVCDRGVKAKPVATDVRMVDGQLHVSCIARWTDVSGDALHLRRESDRLVRVLPEEIATALPPGLLDVTDELKQARSDLSVIGRDTKVGWPLESRYENRLVPLSGSRVALETSTVAVCDPRTAGMNHPLELDQWRIACRSSFAGFYSHPFVSYAGRTFVALVDGRVVVASASKHGNLLLDVETEAKAVLAATSPDVAAATVRRRGARRRVVVPVAGVSCTGVTRLPMRFRLRKIDGDRSVNGRGHVVGDDAGARLEIVLGRESRLSPGRYRLLVDGPGKGWARRQGWITEIVVRVGRGGRLARLVVEREPLPPGRRRPVWG